MSDTNDPFRLDGRTALITGPTRGIGLATARLFAKAGAKLILAGIEAEACDELARELGATSIPTDVSDPTALERLSAECGEIDVLVCNAGIAGPAGPMHEASEQAVDDLYAVNLHHPIMLTSLIAPQMAEHSGGSIVLLSSIPASAATRPSATMA